MTKFSVSTEHGSYLIDGETLSEYDGLLTISDESGEDIAIFAKGQWFSVIKIEDVDTVDSVVLVPRVWNSLTEAPLGVEVVDRVGDLWQAEGSYGSTEFDHWGPFTEVLDV